jgi:hypothetical protein
MGGTLSRFGGHVNGHESVIYTAALAINTLGHVEFINGYFAQREAVR